VFEARCEFFSTTPSEADAFTKGAGWLPSGRYEMPTQEAATKVTRKVMYAGKPAYLIPSPCCDKFDYFYDARGVILCAPSGGFTGRGDGSCPEVLGTASAKDS
jgi:hypothetical protein